jgi:hypothetical protein
MRWPIVDADVPWSDHYLQLTRPERILPLDELGEGVCTERALSPFGVTSPFRILSDEGAEIAWRICTELAPFATGDERISRRVRSGIYQSAFLRGLAHDPTLVEFLAELTQAPLAAHPVSHQAIHINYAPSDLSRHVVDDWHTDTSVSFDYVMMVSDPRPMKGGQFEYFLGSPGEAEHLLEQADDLPAERVVQPTFPGSGWAVLMQGHQVVHRAHRLLEPYPRITLIGSYMTTHASLPDPQDWTGPLTDSDPEDVALIEWARYTAVVAARRLLETADRTTDLEVPLAELRAAMEGALAGPLDAIARLQEHETVSA